MALYGNPNLTQIERFFETDEIIVSKTDLSGKITYGNRTFYRLAGFEEKDCLGVQHNLIRHPDMPRAVFNLLWKTIEAGDEIFAYVINRSANGDHYWVFAHVTPNRDTSGNINGYHSTRRVPNRKAVNEHIIPLYENLLSIEKKASSASKGMEDATNVVLDLLNEKKVSFNQLMFSITV